jgi:tetratricopeptide (TPR) repeat protein
MTILRVSIMALAAMLYALSIHALDRIRHTSVVEEMQVALPRFVQVGLAGGDRYLAANINGFRALVASTERMKADNFKIQGRVQQDVAWLNPAHEDNYYIAAAILPWNGEVDAAQDVLLRAINARPTDWQPIFYYAFNLYYFKHDPVSAAQWLQKALPLVS